MEPVAEGSVAFLSESQKSLEQSRSPVRADRLALLVLFLPGLILGLLAFQPELIQNGDNAEYLILARSLFTGHGYNAISNPIPHPETQRPPGYPLFLAAVMLVFGPQLWLLKTTSLLLMLISAWLAYRVLRAQPNSTLVLTLFGVGLFIWNIGILCLAVTTQSEMLYTALTLATLLGAMQCLRGERASCARPAVWLMLTIVTAVAAIYVRPNGITLIPALAAFFGVHRKWREVLLGLALGAALLSPLALMQMRAMRQGPTYMKYVTTAETAEGEATVHGLSGLLTRTWQTAKAQTLNLGQLILLRPTSWQLRPRPIVEVAETQSDEVAPEPPEAPSPLRLLRRASRYLLGLAVLFGFVVSWRGRGSIIHWYTLLNILFLLACPFPRGRYLLPLQPLWGWFLGFALLWISQAPWRSPTLKRGVGYGLLSFIALPAVIFTGVMVTQQALLNYENRGLSWHAPQRYALAGSDFVNYAAAVEWLGSHTEPQAIIVCRKPYGVYLISGRRTTWEPLWQQDPAAVWASIVEQANEGPVYIIQDGFVNRFHGDTTQRYLLPALQAHRGMLQPLLTLQHPETIVWRLVEKVGPR